MQSHVATVFRPLPRGQWILGEPLECPEHGLIVSLCMILTEFGHAAAKESFEIGFGSLGNLNWHDDA